MDVQRGDSAKLNLVSCGGAGEPREGDLGRFRLDFVVVSLHFLHLGQGLIMWSFDISCTLVLGSFDFRVFWCFLEQIVTRGLFYWVVLLRFLVSLLLGDAVVYQFVLSAKRRIDRVWF